MNVAMRTPLFLFAAMLVGQPPLSAAAHAETSAAVAGRFDQLFRQWKAKDGRAAPAKPGVQGAPITSAMGMRYHPILGRKRFHAGVDLAVPAGTPIHATADGEVVRAGEAGGYGLLVILHHPSGYETRYAHMARIAVTPGRKLRRGDVVGYVGSTGLSTGPHLHYEVRRGGERLSPLGFLPD